MKYQPPGRRLAALCLVSASLLITSTPRAVMADSDVVSGSWELGAVQGFGNWLAFRELGLYTSDDADAFEPLGLLTFFIATPACMTLTDPTQGQAMTINWASIYGGLFLDATGMMAGADRRKRAGLAALGHWAGLTLGILAARRWRPSSGRVGLGVTTALWSTAAVFAATEAANRGHDPVVYSLVSGLGLAVGMTAWDAWRISRRQTWALDLGALVGGFIGFGLMNRMESWQPGANQSRAGGFLGGMVAGTVVAGLMVHMSHMEPGRE